MIFGLQILDLLMGIIRRSGPYHWGYNKDIGSTCGVWHEICIPPVGLTRAYKYFILNLWNIEHFEYQTFNTLNHWILNTLNIELRKLWTMWTLNLLKHWIMNTPNHWTSNLLKLTHAIKLIVFDLHINYLFGHWFLFSIWHWTLNCEVKIPIRT